MTSSSGSLRFRRSAVFLPRSPPGYYAKKAFDREQARDERRDTEQREAQASLVAAWMMLDPQFGMSTPVEN
jgi:hypothetical protein